MISSNQIKLNQTKPITFTKPSVTLSMSSLQLTTPTEFGYSVLDECLYKINTYAEYILDGFQVEMLPGSLRHIDRHLTTISREIKYPDGERTIIHEYIDRIVNHGDMLVKGFTVSELPSTMRRRE